MLQDDVGRYGPRLAFPMETLTFDGQAVSIGNGHRGFDGCHRSRRYVPNRSLCVDATSTSSSIVSSGANSIGAPKR